MRSSPRNIRKRYRAVGLAIPLALLHMTTQAAEPAHCFVFTAFSNGAGGAELVSGGYTAAVQQLSHPVVTSMDAGTTSNNQCVALAMTRQWEAARLACDRAVRDAQLERTSLPSYQSWARQLKDDYLAVALSNRAVLHWLASDSGAAADDLQRAEALSPRAEFVARNRAALEYSRTAVAQVSVAPAH